MTAVMASLPLVGSLASDIVSAFARAIGGGIVGLADWALGALTHAAVSTTEPSFDSWFTGPWRAMAAVAGLVAVPLLLFATVSALVRGEGPGGVARVLGRLGLATVGMVLALGLVRLVLGLVDEACALVEGLSGVSLAGALARLGTAVGLGAVAGGGTAGAVGTILLALVAGVAAFVLWVELALRTALLVVATAFLPLGLAGLIWPATAGWARRLAEVVVAVAASKLVIVVVLVLGAAALSTGALSLATPGADLDVVVQGVAFLGLATFGLPMALRLVPVAAEAAIHAGRGATAARAVASAPARVNSGLSTTQSVLARVNSSTSSAASSKGGATASGGSSPSRPASTGTATPSSRTAPSSSGSAK